MKERAEEAAKSSAARDNIASKLAEAVNAGRTLRLENDLLRVENYRLRHGIPGTSSRSGSLGTWGDELLPRVGGCSLNAAERVAGVGTWGIVLRHRKQMDILMLLLLLLVVAVVVAVVVVGVFFPGSRTGVLLHAVVTNHSGVCLLFIMLLA